MSLVWSSRGNYQSIPIMLSSSSSCLLLLRQHGTASADGSKISKRKRELVFIASLLLRVGAILVAVATAVDAFLLEVGED